MEIESIERREQELMAQVIDLSSQPMSLEVHRKYDEIYSEYKKIHLDYASLAPMDLEALKRALFIQWYVMTTPHFCSGINEVDPAAELAIMSELTTAVKSNTWDKELEAMLKHYTVFDFVFERFPEFQSVYKKRSPEFHRSDFGQMDLDMMDSRGQMGQYWASLEDSNVWDE